MTRTRKILIAAALTTMLSGGAMLLWAHRRVAAAGDRIYQDPATVEFRPVGLVLGTAPRLANGMTNLYFRYRMEAAAELYRAGKVRKLLVSGDHHRRDYNEPLAMCRALEELGVPRQDIVLDYAGFRTLDSVLRAHLVFGQRRFTVISQQFHCERALYLAQRYGLDAIGFAAREVPSRYHRRSALREIPARLLAVIDAALGRQPHFPGPPEPIRLTDTRPAPPPHREQNPTAPPGV